MADPAKTHPFVAALPPETDYITYLTLIEYNLDLTNVSILQDILQKDTEEGEPALIINVGWDLVALLLPLLPASRGCLLLIARHGNPREVVLKVAEALENVEWALEDVDETSAGRHENEENEHEDEHVDEQREQNVHPALRTKRSASRTTAHDKGARSSNNINNATSRSQEPTIAQTPTPAISMGQNDLPYNQFTILTNMLSILHPRIRTAKLSRFAATTLGTVLTAFNNAPVSQLTKLVPSLTQLAKAMDMSGPPALPPRNQTVASSASNATNGEGADKNRNAPKAPDPEAEAPSSISALGSVDASIHRRLLQSFITHLAYQYADAFGTIDGENDLPGLVWAPRQLEMYQPDLNVPGRKTWAQRCEDDGQILSRVGAMRGLLCTARKMGIGYRALTAGAAGRDVEEAVTGGRDSAQGEHDETEDGDEGYQDEGIRRRDSWLWNEDTLPERASDVRLSPLGCLHLLAAWQNNVASLTSSPPASAVQNDALVPIAIFPQHASILNYLISSASAPLNNAAHLDAVLSLGIHALSSNTINAIPSSSEHSPSFTHPPKPEPTTSQTTTYLRHSATISATASSPSLRFAAHTLTTTVLRSHPSDALRLAFIRSVLEESPFPNLKVSAVGWLKGCIVDGNADLFGAATAGTQIEKKNVNKEQAKEEDKALFSTPLPLALLSPLLFATDTITAYLPPTPHLPPPPSSSNTENAEPTTAATTTTTTKTTTPQTQATQTQHASFAPTIPFHLTILNTYYFLLRAPSQLRQRLDLQHIHHDAGVADYLDMLKEAARLFGSALESLGPGNERMVGQQGGGEREVNGIDAARAELVVLEERVERVLEGVAAVGL